MHWTRYFAAALPLLACAQPIPLSDEACRQEFARIAPQCEGSAALKECQRKRLSPACFKEVEAGAGVKSAACKKQLEQASAPCQEASKRCIEQNVNASCKDRAARFAEARKACDEAVQRVWQLCNTEPLDTRAKCFEKHRGAASAVCK